MWFKKKEIKVEEEIVYKPNTYRRAIELTLVDHRTNKEYVYKSDNDFGLDWELIEGLLHIKQYRSLTSYDWEALAAFADCSIIHCTWNKFEIKK